MAARGSTAIEEEEKKRERLVKELYLENGSIFVDQEVFRACWDRISRWVDISILVGYLMKYGVATNPDDIQLLTSPYYLPEQRRAHLFTCAGRGTYGFFLLYWCIRESRRESPLGHGDATKELERCATQFATVPPWDRPAPTYIRPGNTIVPMLDQSPPPQHCPQGGIGTAAAPVSGEGRPPASLITEQRREVVEVNRSNSGNRAKYEKTTTESTTQIRRSRGGGASVVATGNPITTQPQQETQYRHHPQATYSDSHSEGAHSGSSNQTSEHPYSDIETDSPGGVMTHATPISGATPLSPKDDENDKYLRQLGEKHTQDHNEIVKLVKSGAVSQLHSNPEAYCLCCVPQCNSEKQLEETIVRFVVGSLNIRYATECATFVQLLGVECGGPDLDRFSIKGIAFTHLGGLKGLEERVFSQIADQENGSVIPPADLEKIVKIEAVSVSDNEPQAKAEKPSTSSVVVVTVHPSWQLCKQKMYCCSVGDKNGQAIPGAVYKMDLETCEVHKVESERGIRSIANKLLRLKV